MKLLPSLAAAILALPLSLALPASAQEKPSKSTDQPPIAEVRILVQDWGSREDLEPVGPGETLTLAVGQQVRLRMQAIPTSRNRSPRYPSARFRLISGERRVRLSKANEETGRVLVAGERTDDPGNRPTVLRYEIIDPLNASSDLLANTIEIAVVAEATAADPVETKPADRRGATLFEHDDFTGRSELFRAGEVADLRLHSIGNDRASSVRVDEGCLVELFSSGQFRGESVLLNYDSRRLADTPVGNDTVSSLRVECGDDSAPLPSLPGITLFSETDFRGRSQHITWDVASLSGSEIGDNQARSIELSAGCVAVLYDGAGFRGESTELRSSEASLDGTRIGLDRVSSIRVRCQ